MLYSENVNVLLGEKVWGSYFLNMFFALVAVCSLVAKITYAEERQQNNYPIILVNGFAGWGREEMLGVKYWGGVHDIQEDLNAMVIQFIPQLLDQFLVTGTVHVNYTPKLTVEQ